MDICVRSEARVIDVADPQTFKKNARQKDQTSIGRMNWRKITTNRHR